MHEPPKGLGKFLNENNSSLEKKSEFNSHELKILKKYDSNWLWDKIND